MKKILNDPYAYVAEMLEGLVLAHPEYYERAGSDGRVIKRPGAPVADKVGIVSGGGSGHLPIFTGYVGKGLLDACAIGEVFASPSVEQMAEAMRAANGGAGVLRLYGNYGGDCMNFDMAGDMLDMEDVPSTTVLLADDVASAPKAEASKRRGVASLPNLLTSPRYSNLSTLRSKPQRDRESEHVWSEMLSHEGVMVFVSTASSRVFGSATLCAAQTDNSAIISYVHPRQGRRRPPKSGQQPNDCNALIEVAGCCAREERRDS